MDLENKLLNKAFENYNLDERDDIDKQLLSFIDNRLIANKDNIEKIIEILKVDYSFEEIYKCFKEEVEREDISYKETKLFKKYNNEFFEGIYAVPKGNIIIETDDVYEIVRSFVKAIRSRNTIVISKLDYNEISIESMLLIIFSEAINNYGIDRNMIMIMPYEECYYDDADEVIIYENGAKSIKEKEINNDYAIYLENNIFKNEALQDIAKLKEQNIHVQLFDGDLYGTINEINKIKPKAVAIYTESNEISYRFINLIKSKNVFVNTTLLNVEEIELDNELYYYKKIIYPMINYDNNDTNTDTDSNENENKNNNLKQQFKIQAIEQNNQNIANNKTNNKEELSLEVKSNNPWYKRIFDAIKNLFKK